MDWLVLAIYIVASYGIVRLLNNHIFDDPSSDDKSDNED